MWLYENNVHVSEGRLVLCIQNSLQDGRMWRNVYR